MAYQGREAVIVGAVRTPVGKGKASGALHGVLPADLLAHSLRDLVQRAGVEPGQIDDVIAGAVTQVGDQGVNIARNALLGAGFPESVPGTTVDRQCGSSQQAISFAAQGVVSGAYDLVIAGGVESMSRVPMGSSRIGKSPYGPSFEARYAPGLISQGAAAELMVARWSLSREALDQYAAQSHQRAAAARSAGAFKREIVPIRTAAGVVESDETIRPDTSVERLAALSPAFRDPVMSERFPEIRWHITAGNSSQMTDGAAALLLMSENTAVRLGLRPRATFVAFDAMGDDPLVMLTAPIPSSRRALAKSGLTLEAISHYEINEAFAPVPLAWAHELKADMTRLNPRGGAIALGHPLGASGARLMTTLLHALEDNGGRFGLQSMCEAGGMANTTIIERL
jgi:acetyl-CoA acetyltransferase family protein